MPLLKDIKGPDGKLYSLEAPEGATMAEAEAEVARRVSVPDEGSFMGGVGRSLGTGIASTVDLVDIASRGFMPFNREPIGTARERVQGLMAKMGMAREVNEPPANMIERAAEFAGSAVAPTGGMMALGRQVLKRGQDAVQKHLINRMLASSAAHPGKTIAMEGLAATGAGAGGELANATDPDNAGLQIGAETVGGIAAPGMLGPLVVNQGTKLVNAGRNIYSATRGAGVQTRADEEMARAAGHDALAKLDAETLLPMSTGQKIASPDVVGKEQAVAAINPAFAARQAELEQQQQALIGPRIGEVFEGTPDDATSAVRQTRQQRIQRRNAETARTQAKAEEALNTIGREGDYDLAEIGKKTKAEVAAMQKDRNELEDYAFGKVDKTAPVDYENAVTQHQKFMQTLGQDVPTRESIPTWLDETLSAYAADPSPRTVQDALALRSTVLNKIRAEAAAPAPNENYLRGLNMVQEGLLKDLEKVPGDDIKRALKVARQNHETFGQGPVARILGNKLAPEEAIRSIYTGSNEKVGSNIDRLIKASPESAGQVEQFLKAEFLNTVFNKGKPVAGAAQQFLGMQKNVEALKRFPKLRQQLMDVSSAQRLHDQALARGELYRDSVLKSNQSVMRQYLDADPGTAVKKVLSGGNPQKNLAKLFRAMKKNPKAVDGLRADVLQHVLDTATVEGKITGASLRKAVDKNRQALNGVALTPTQRARLDQVVGELERIDTPAGEAALIGDASHKLLVFAAGTLANKSVGQVVTGGPGSLRTAGRVASLSEDITRKMLAKTDKAREAIVAGILDEDVFREMVARAPVEQAAAPGGTAFKRTFAWLAGVGNEEEDAP